MSYIDDQMNAGALKRTPTSRFSPEMVERAMVGVIRNGPQELSNLSGAMMGEGVAFDSRSTGLAPGESFRVGRDGVNLRGRNTGVNVGFDGSAGVDYTSDDGKFSVGVRGRMPRGGMGGSIEGNFSVGRPDPVVGTPGGAVDDALGVSRTMERAGGPSPAQQYLNNYLDKYKGMSNSSIQRGSF